VEIIELIDLAADAWNRHDGDAYVALHAEDYEIVTPDLTAKGHDGVRQFWAANWGPFPENQITVLRVVADGTTVVEEGVFAGTNTGPLPMPDGTELPATGATVSIPYMAWHTVRDGLFTSSHFYWDSIAFLQQLGLMQQ